MEFYYFSAFVKNTSRIGRCAGSSPSIKPTSHIDVGWSILDKRILMADVIGTERNAPMMPHNRFQSTSAKSTVMGWMANREPNNNGLTA